MKLFKRLYHFMSTKNLRNFQGDTFKYGKKYGLQGYEEFMTFNNGKASRKEIDTIRNIGWIVHYVHLNADSLVQDDISLEEAKTILCGLATDKFKWRKQKIEHKEIDSFMMGISNQIKET